jgi:hypothetical protein
MDRIIVGNGKTGVGIWELEIGELSIKTLKVSFVNYRVSTQR